MAMFEIKPERIEIIPPDYALAYSVLARRIAAIDAILRSDQWPEHCIKRLRAESGAAMETIKQVETVRFTISTLREGGCQ
jgi:hypothetical protein